MSFEVTVVLLLGCIGLYLVYIGWVIDKMVSRLCELDGSAYRCVCQLRDEETTT